MIIRFGLLLLVFVSVPLMGRAFPWWYLSGPYTGSVEYSDRALYEQWEYEKYTLRERERSNQPSLLEMKRYNKLFERPVVKKKRKKKRRRRHRY